MDEALVNNALASLVSDGRVRPSAQDATLFVSDGCVLPLGSPVGWEVAVFDHFQAMVMALCAKLDSGSRHAGSADLIGGSTFSFRVWPEHPYYEEATRFLATFRADGSALRKKIAAFNEQHAASSGSEQRVIIYAGQTVLDNAVAVEQRE
jgi:hypothetical protein